MSDLQLLGAGGMGRFQPIGTRHVLFLDIRVSIYGRVSKPNRPPTVLSVVLDKQLIRVVCAQEAESDQERQCQTIRAQAVSTSRSQAISASLLTAKGASEAGCTSCTGGTS